LSVSDCTQVTDFGVYEVAKLGASLRYLSVAKCDQVSDAGIKQVARYCHRLRYAAGKRERIKSSYANFWF
jgi:F-box and leucine-rich repeat protein 7